MALPNIIDTWKVETTLEDVDISDNIFTSWVNQQEVQKNYVICYLYLPHTAKQQVENFAHFGNHKLISGESPDLQATWLACIFSFIWVD